jgi:voltage-gated potassium channel
MKEESVSPFQLVILGISVYVLIGLSAVLFFDLADETVRLILIIDTVACLIFLWDFFYRLYQAENKKDFLKWGWIDFIASIPMIEPLRWGRLFRVLRILRVLRGFRSARTLLSFVFRNRRNGAFACSLLTVIASC